MKPLAVVGIGASAGGLEALQAMIQNLPSNTDFAFVIIQHLSRKHKSMMREILSKSTTLEIISVDTSQELRANTIYLNSPQFQIEVFENQLIATRVSEPEHFDYPIDRFFSSLSSTYLDRTVAIILSGTGSDGLIGARNVKAHGGIVLAQELQSAKFDSMPGNVMNSEISAQSLMPEEMGDYLLKISNEFREKSVPITISQTQWQRIFEIIHLHTSNDFRLYKKGTMLRRIEKRLLVANCKSIDQYLAIMGNNVEEVRALAQDFLIGVTEFFRNPDSFEVLSKFVFPELCKDKKPDQEIRVWTMGCSTGQETYSIAIVLNEYLESAGMKNNIRIFATDISEEALKTASRGEYDMRSIQSVPQNLLEKYFHQDGQIFRIKQCIRRLVTFAPHNIVSNPPYSNIDLVVCRNVLIYFLPELQSKVINVLEFCLRSGGFIFLGISESLGLSETNFDLVDLKHRIFRKKRQTYRRISPWVTDFDLKSARLPHEVVAPSPQPPHIQFRNEHQTFYRAYLDAHLSDGIVVDDQRRLVHITGDAKRMINYASGPASLSLNRVFEPAFAEVLLAGISKALAISKPVKSNAIKISADLGRSSIGCDLVFEPVAVGRKDHFYVVIRMLGVDETAASEVDTIDLHVTEHRQLIDERIESLERELYDAKNLHNEVAQQLEITNQELQATNEELISSNEELQSTNEELQSLNEELHTVNSEYQNKIDEMMTSNQINDTVFHNKDIGLLILDQHLRIVRFSEGMKMIVQLMPHDIGRSIDHLKFLHEAVVSEILNQLIQKRTSQKRTIPLTGGPAIILGTIHQKDPENIFYNLFCTRV